MSASTPKPPSATNVLLDPFALFRLARDSVSAWLDDFAPSMGAAISYYTVFSIAPLMLIVIAMTVPNVLRSGSLALFTIA